MARHAAQLGYDGIALFLDELILWLSYRASDSSWLHNEVQKTVKLLEAQESDQRIPIVSFIARQRDLAEMAGKIHTGAEHARLHDSLNHWEGRYGTITLGDQNLPEIVEKRILTPRGPEQKASVLALRIGQSKPVRTNGRGEQRPESPWRTLTGRRFPSEAVNVHAFSCRHQRATDAEWVLQG